MNSNEILKADVLDILFDNRNKQYGAYVLRKNYNQRLGMALGIGLGMTALMFILIPKNNSSEIFRDADHGDVIIKHVELPKKIETLPPPVTKKTEVVYREKQFTRMVIVDKEDVATVADINELDKSIISTMTKDGLELNGNISVINQPPPVIQEKEIVKEKPVEPPISREPEFPGGQQAWLNFLRNNLVAPEGLEPGETKTVQIRFQVDTDGAVTGFEVLKSAGRSFDNEVIRVLRRMPKWKPAIQSGHPVARAFTQPVTFIGSDQ